MSKLLVWREPYWVVKILNWKLKYSFTRRPCFMCICINIYIYFLGYGIENWHSLKPMQLTIILCVFICKYKNIISFYGDGLENRCLLRRKSPWKLSEWIKQDLFWKLLLLNWSQVSVYFVWNLTRNGLPSNGNPLK